MKYCLIGEKLGHSYSAEIHEKQGLDYGLREIEKENLSAFFKEGYDGFNVTIPYKKAVIPYLAGLSERAKKTGAVNTVVKTENGYFGHNTDIGGMEFALKRKGVSLYGKKVMILGSGGASVTALSLCEEKGATAVTVSRSGAVNYENCYDEKGVDIIINATPVGMFPDCYSSPVDLSRFTGLEFVFDCVYNPFKTKLLAQAEKLGIGYSDGLPMLVKQALLAEEIWGVKTEDGKDESIISDLYRKKINIVLCGMPASGKTTVGKIVAEKLGRKFFDTDKEIKKKTGRTPAEIIEKDGEKKFRDIETEVVTEIAKNNSSVIATGGGAVLRSENVNALKCNGVVFGLDRKLELLSSDGRPLSKSKSVQTLYEERKEYYKRASDYTVDCNGKATDCADNIVKIISCAEFNPPVKGEL